MRPLIVTAATLEAIDKVRSYAEENPISHDEMIKIREGTSKPPGDNPKFVVHIDMGYRVVFTVEHHPRKMRHISVSVDAPGKLVPIASFAHISKPFGFKGERGMNAQQHVWIENLGDGFQALNVVEPY
jgi:hypothetical protein